MKIISLKPCLFGGKKYEQGEEIPSDVIECGRVKTLVRIGTIALREEPDVSEADALQDEAERSVVDEAESTNGEAQSVKPGGKPKKKVQQ